MTDPFAKRFTTTEFDKFKNRTTLTWKDPMKGKILGSKWADYEYTNIVFEGSDDNKKSFTESLALGMRCVKSDDGDTYVLDYQLIATDWMFIKSGSIIIHLYGRVNVTLQPIESDTEVFDGGKIRETGYCVVSLEQMQQIAASESVEVRVSGSATYIDIEPRQQLKFLFMVRSMLAECNGDRSYDQWIQSIVPAGSEAKGRFTQEQILKAVFVGGIIIAAIAYAFLKH